MNLKNKQPVNIICGICGSSDNSVIWEKPSNVICKNCSFVFINPRPSKKDLDKYYKNISFTSGKVFKEFKPGSRSYMLTKERAGFLKKCLPIKTGAILDVGCGTGEFLLSFDRSKWDLFGIDPTPYAVEKAKQKGLNVFLKDIEGLRFSKGTFDLICIISVLEHVYSPKGTLIKIRNLLKPGGYLFLEVPNILETGDGVSELNTSEHLSHFSYRSLKFLLNRVGFKIVSQDRKCRVPNIRLLAKSVEKKFKTVAPRGDYRKVLDFISREMIRDRKIKSRLRDTLDNLFLKTKEKIVIYGAGNHSVLLNNLVSLENKNCAFVDSDPKKWGTFLFSKKIYPPRAIAKIQPSKIIISSEAFQDEIYNSLKRFKRSGIQIIKLY